MLLQCYTQLNAVFKKWKYIFKKWNNLNFNQEFYFTVCNYSPRSAHSLILFLLYFYQDTLDYGSLHCAVVVEK